MVSNVLYKPKSKVVRCTAGSTFCKQDMTARLPTPLPQADHSPVLRCTNTTPKPLHCKLTTWASSKLHKLINQSCWSLFFC